MFADDTDILVAAVKKEHAYIIANDIFVEGIYQNDLRHNRLHLNVEKMLLHELLAN